MKVLIDISKENYNRIQQIVEWDLGSEADYMIAEGTVISEDQGRLCDIDKLIDYFKEMRIDLSSKCKSVTELEIRNNMLLNFIQIFGNQSGIGEEKWEE